MASKKKEIIGHIVTEDGKKREVIGENNRYWLCKNCQFSKLNKNVTFTPRKEND